MSRPQDRTLQAILTSADLPTLPVVAAKVLELTAQEEVSIVDIIALISQDIALSSKLLKVANSAFYNFPQQITSVQQAVSLLGVNAVRSLVLSFSFLSMGQGTPATSFDFTTFWQHSLIGAAAARLIAEQTGLIDPEEMFTLGLLQNIGQMIFALTMPQRYAQLLEQCRTSSATPDITLEEEYLGLNHTVAGAEVAQVWGLPTTLHKTLRYHHDPLACPADSPKLTLAVKIIHLADLVAAIYASSTPTRAHDQFQEKARELLDLETLEVATIFRIISKEIDKSARFFGVSMQPVRPVQEIIQEANIRLSLLHLSYEEVNRELRQTKATLEELRQQLIERNRLLERLANLDGLTEIHNHRFFQSFLQAEINRSHHNRCPISLLLADIDHFKHFNDTHGHQTGDFILKELCMTVGKIIREYDLMARYGGEEFAFVLPETGAEAARVVAEKIRRFVEEHDFFDGIRHYRVTLSIGVATALPEHEGFRQNDFIDQADRALYEAKNRGRNRISIAAPSRIKWLPR